MVFFTLPANMTKGLRVEAFNKAFLPILTATVISSILTATNGLAQEECEDLEGAPPGLYTATDEGATYLDKDGQIFDVDVGEIAFANDAGIRCITKLPGFLDWPCSTDPAQARKFSTYSLDDIANEPNRALAIVKRYFEIPEVIEPVPHWKDGEYHLTMSLEEILQFSGPEYWYHLYSPESARNEKRPHSLLISLYVGLNRVVVDANVIQALVNVHGQDAIPVKFEFNDSNTVPVSYFGENVSLEEIQRANAELGIKVAEVPMWELGDHTLRPTAAEYESLFDLPAMEDIPPDQAAALRQDLETNGFSRKPIFATLLTNVQRYVLDEPQRVRVAIAMGFPYIPTYVITAEPDSYLARCGPGTPLGSRDASIPTLGPPASATVPPGVAPPPPPEPEVSDS